MDTETVYMSEAVETDLKALAETSYPFETGGILLGVVRDDLPWVTHVVEVTDLGRTRTAFEIPYGVTPAVVEIMRSSDRRLGYLGDWHSHPGDIGPSPKDRGTLRRDGRRVKPEQLRSLLAVVRLTGDGWRIEMLADDGLSARRVSVIVTGTLGRTFRDEPVAPQVNPSGRLPLSTKR